MFVFHNDEAFCSRLQCLNLPCLYLVNQRFMNVFSVVFHATPFLEVDDKLIVLENYFIHTFVN